MYAAGMSPASYRVAKRLELGAYYSHYSITSYGGALLAWTFPNKPTPAFPPITSTTKSSRHGSI